jgi:hypothetical protein
MARSGSEEKAGSRPPKANASGKRFQKGKHFEELEVRPNSWTDEIQTKVLRVFLLAIQSPPLLYTKCTALP